MAERDALSLPQRALGADGRDIALLWTNTVAFQKLQRFAHGDIALRRLSRLSCAAARRRPRALCLYASDAEIFDFRPGRYRTEEANQASSEWQRIDAAFAGVRREPGCALVAPSARR